jgi:hypothetical protein
MAIDERQRHELSQQLEATIGEASAETLMSMLPPVGWADVATKQDVAVLERVLTMKVESEVNRLEAKMHEAMRHQLWAIVGVMLVSLLVSAWLGH